MITNVTVLKIIVSKYISPALIAIAYAAGLRGAKLKEGVVLIEHKLVCSEPRIIRIRPITAFLAAAAPGIGLRENSRSAGIKFKNVMIDHAINPACYPNLAK